MGKRKGVVMKKKLIVIALAMAFAGCSNLKVEWVMSYKTDNLKEDLKK
jgi:hypothetical protein